MAEELIIISDLPNNANPSLDSAIEIEERSDPEEPVANHITVRQLLTLAQKVLVGSANYQDTATAVTPLVGVANTPLALTNNNLGAQAYSDLPSGIGPLWDTATDSFDFSSLAPIDDVEMRLHIEVTTQSANQEVRFFMDMAQGGFEYEIPLVQAVVKTASSFPMTRYTAAFMGDSNTIDNPAQLMIESDGAFTAIVRGWYMKVRRKTF